MEKSIYCKVLCLNAAWLPIGVCTVKKALEDMNGLRTPKKALKIEYDKKEKGEYDFNKPIEIIPLEWDLWAQLGPREFDKDCVRTTNLTLRVPTVIITPKYNKIPVKTFSCTKRNLFKHYGGKDYWTGEELSYNEATIDHIISRDEWRRKGLKGSPNNWGNMALTKGEINRLKSNMPPDEFQKKYGYKPHHKLTEPKPVPASVIIKSILNPDWAIFLKI